MGCDIHLYVERRVDGVWTSADKWTPSDYTDNGLSVGFDDMFYTDRNYLLFAILAGVRNYWDIKPIVEPRGIPDDASPEVKALELDHTPSWLTTSELLAFDWTQEVTLSGWVDPIGWAQWRERPKNGPETYSRSVGGGLVKHLTPEQFEAAWTALRIIRKYPETRRATAHLRTPRSADIDNDLDTFITLLGVVGAPYCRVSWTVPYWKQTSDFFGTVIPRLLALGSPDDVRIVFFFDN